MTTTRADFSSPRAFSNARYLGWSLSREGITIGRFVEWHHKPDCLDWSERAVAQVWLEYVPDVEDPVVLFTDGVFDVDEVHMKGLDLDKHYLYTGCYFDTVTPRFDGDILTLEGTVRALGVERLV